MGMKEQENKETNTKTNYNTDEKTKKKGEKKKAVITIIGIFFLVIVVYNLMLSRVEEDIYFTRYNRNEKISTLCYYDASENQIFEIAELEGSMHGGAVDYDQGKFTFWHYEEERGFELATYDLESGQTEIYFTEDEMEESTGLTLEQVIFDRTDKSFVYLRFSKMADDGKQLLLAKYDLETKEVTDIQEIDHNYTLACNGDFYVVSEGFLDVATDGNVTLLSEQGDFGRRYFINNPENGTNITVARLSEITGDLFSYKQMQFIGESYDCVYVRSMMTVFDIYIDMSLWIKEPGHIARKIFSFGFSPSEKITILY